ncbi:MAG TPA: hypothetical protein VF188_08225 [Longimicrobiales bacterium]
MIRPEDILFWAGGNVLARYGTLVRRTRPDAPGIDFSRASGGTLVGRTGTLREAGPDVPRIHWLDRDGDGAPETPVLRLEPQRTNQIRNPRCEGAVVGVVGSGGALPTFWSLFSPGIAVEIVGTGTEDGMSYVDVRLSGTPTATTGALIGLDGGNHASAAAGEVWTGSLYARLVAGSLSGALGVQIELSERDASGAVLQTHRGDIAVTDLPRLSVARHVHTATLVQAATAAVRALLRVPVTQGVPVDLTLRLAGPQLERGPYPSSLILPDVGAPAVSTRAMETVSADVSALNPPRAIAVYMRCIKGYAGDGGHPAPRLWTVSDSGDTPPRATVYVGSVGLLRFSHRTSPSVSSDAGVVGSETARGDQVEALAILLPDGSPSLAVSINGGPVLSGSSGPLAFAQAWSAARIHIAGPVSSGPLDLLDLLILRGASWTLDDVRRLVS